MKQELSIVMPFYNEEENVEKVCYELIQELNKSKINYEIIAVNNGSYDRTPELLSKLANEFLQIKIVTVNVNQGYGFGVIQGLKYASGEYIGYMAGDGQIEPSDVVNVFNKIKQENLDLGQGKRIERHDGLIRKVISKGFNTIFQILFLSPISDIGSNPKIFRKSLYEKSCPITSKDWFIDSEILLKAVYLKSKIGEVPLVFKKREKGSSHVRPIAIIQMLKNMIIWKIKEIFGGEDYVFQSKK